VVVGRAQGRGNDAEVTIFDSVGFALEDFSALRYVHRLHREELGRARPSTSCPSSPTRRTCSHCWRSARPSRLWPHRRLRRMQPAAGHGMSRHPRTAALIGAPTDVGASERGASMGPEALRVAGLTRRLEEYGCAWWTAATSPAPPTRAVRPRWVTDTSPRSSSGTASCTDAVLDELHLGHLPVLLGGDHSLGIGSISAVARHCRDTDRRLRVLWLDAHADSTLTRSRRAATCTACRSPACAASVRRSC